MGETTPWLFSFKLSTLSQCLSVVAAVAPELQDSCDKLGTPWLTLALLGCAKD